MKCKDCQVEMEKGFLDNGVWIGGTMGRINLSMVFSFKMWKKVIAWHCPNCKKIELYTEEK